MKIHNSRVKRVGIRYGELNHRDIMLSFIQKNDKKLMKKIVRSFKIEGDFKEEEPRQPLQAYFVISRNSTLFMVFHSIYTICCIFSCYFYVALASFQNMQTYSASIKITLFLESVFLLNIIISFFVEYKEVGHTQPVRDLYKCAMNYLQSSQFVYEFITIIPLQWLQFDNYELMRWIYLLKLLRLIKGF